MIDNRYAIMFLRLRTILLVFLAIIFMAALPAHGEVSELRTVTIYVVIDANGEFSSVQVAKNVIKNLVSELSRIFEIKFHVSFAISGIEHQTFPSYREDIDFRATLFELKQIHHRVTADIVIGFSERFFWKCVEVTIPIGYILDRERCEHDKLMMKYEGIVDSNLGNIAVVRIGTLETFHTLLHEVGHLFGGEHTDARSIMNTEMNDVLTIDGWNQKIIHKYRLRKFR